MRGSILMTSLGFSHFAGNVLQHIWQSFFLSAPSHNRFYDTLCVFLASSSPLSFFHPHVSAFSSRSPSVTALPWALPAHIVQPRCTLTEQRASLCTRAAVLMCEYLHADAPSKRQWTWFQCNIKRALGGQTAKSDFTFGLWVLTDIATVIFPIHIFASGSSPVCGWLTGWCFYAVVCHELELKLTYVVWVVWSKSFTPTLLFKSLGPVRF